MKLSIEQLKEILNLAEKYDYKPDEWHRKNLANSCGSDEIVSMVRELISLRELKGDQVPVAFTGSGSIAAIRVGHEGFIWGESGKAHPIPLYTTPQPAHADEDDWIKCSDDLPDETEDDDGGATGYLVRYENDRVPNGGFNISVSNCVFLRTHWRGLYSHWMPLPAAPKPESE